LRPAAIYEELDAGDVAAVIRGKKENRLGDFIGRGSAAQWRKRCGAYFDLCNLLVGVAQLGSQSRSDDCSRMDDVDPDLALLQFQCPRAYKRPRAALLAASVPRPGAAFIESSDPVITTHEPSGISGSAFCTVKKVPLALMSKV